MKYVVVGAGPVGLLATSLLQRVTSNEIVLVEKRPTYTRERVVKLSPFLFARSASDYDADFYDADNVRAVFDPDDLADLFAAKRAVPADVRATLEELGRGWVSIRQIEESLSALVANHADRQVTRLNQAIDVDQLSDLVEPGDAVLDCTGSHSLLRNVLPSGRRDALFRQDPTTSALGRSRGRRGVGEWDANLLEFVMEHALLVTFTIPALHVCDERCKYYGNEGNTTYTFVPSISRTFNSDGVSNVTGIISMSSEVAAELPTVLDQAWLHSSDHEIARSINRFIEQHIVRLIGVTPTNLLISNVALNLYRARRATNVEYSVLGEKEAVPAFLLGDAAIGSPYFQAISLGFEGAMFLAWLLRDQRQIDADLMWRFETFTTMQWMRVYMRTRSIKANKDILEVFDQQDLVLERLHVF